MTATAILLTLALVVFKSGAWFVPNLRSQFAMSQFLTTASHHVGDHYIYTSYLGPAVFKILGGRSLTAYAVYCGLVSLAFFAVVALVFLRTHDHPWKLLGLAVFPVLMVPFYWVGIDGVTLILMLAIATTLHRRWAWLFAVLLSWQHFEQGMVGFGILALTLALAGRPQCLKKVALVLVLFLVGKAAMLGYFHTVGVHLAANRFDLAYNGMAEFMTQWRSSWPAILWSLLGAGWLLIAGNLRRTWPVLIAVPIALLTVLVVTDQTRVGAIILFPTLVYWLFLNRDLWRELHPASVVAVLLVYLLLPVVYVWGGVTCGSVLEHTIVHVQTRPRVSRWTPLDYLQPFINGVCPRPDMQ